MMVITSQEVLEELHIIFPASMLNIEVESICIGLCIINYIIMYSQWNNCTMD